MEMEMRDVVLQGFCAGEGEGEGVFTSESRGNPGHLGF